MQEVLGTRFDYLGELWLSQMEDFGYKDCIYVCILSSSELVLFDNH